MNIDLVREANGNVYAVCRETGERIQNVQVTRYHINQPHTDINSISGQSFRVMSPPTMEITLQSSLDIRITQLAAPQPPPRPQRNLFFLPGMEQGEAARELGLGRAFSSDPFFNAPLGMPVFSERPSTVTAPADRVASRLARETVNQMAEEMDRSMQQFIGRNTTSELLAQIEQEVMQTFGVPSQVNRNGDSVSVDAMFNGQPATAREIPFGHIPDVNSFRGDRYEVRFDRMQMPQMGPNLTPDEIRLIQPLNLPPIDMRIGASVANVQGLERVNFGMGADWADDRAEGESTEPRAPVSPPVSLFPEDDSVPSLSEHPTPDEIVSADEKFLAFDSTNEVTQELIRLFKVMDMRGISDLLLKASLHGRDFVSEAWSGFTSHLVSEISAEHPCSTHMDLVNLMCLMTPEEAWKNFTLDLDTKGWTAAQWDKLAFKRIRDEMSQPSAVCISSKSVDSIESLDVLV